MASSTFCPLVELTNVTFLSNNSLKRFATGAKSFFFKSASSFTLPRWDKSITLALCSRH